MKCRFMREGCQALTARGREDRLDRELNACQAVFENEMPRALPVHHVTFEPRAAASIFIPRCREERAARPFGTGAGESHHDLFLPLSAPADAMKWTIVVGTRLKQGGVVEYPYPLPVHERRLPAGRT